MNKKILSLLVIFLSIVGLSLFASQGLSNYAMLISNINSQVETSKMNNPLIPIEMQTDTGLYASYVHMNFVGGPIRDGLRNSFWILDNNFFVTAWVMDSIIADINNSNLTSSELSFFSKSLDSLATYHDQNRPETDLVSFWPQSYVKGEANWNYSASPHNLDTLMGDMTNLLSGAIEIINGSLLPGDIKIALVTKLQSIDSFLNLFGSAFKIPADLDDTSLNFALGGNLKDLSDKNSVFTPLYQEWEQTNTIAQISNSLAAAEKYAYTPSSSNTSSMSNLIDPRSYYVLEGFLAPLSSQELQNLKIPTTWLLNMHDEADQYVVGQTSINVGMPFNVNNIDASVVANFVYGIASLYHSGILSTVLASNQSLEAPLVQMINSSRDFLQYILKNNVIPTRSDIALLYYPPKYNLYFFMSRTLSELDGYTFGTDPIDSAMKSINESFRSNLQSYGTAQLESLESQYYANSPFLSWTGFLGNYPDSNSSQSDDMNYSTAVAVNALINTWTYNDNGSLKWLPNVPSNVKCDLKKAATYLKIYTANNIGSMENAFFSGSDKGTNSTMPFSYPTNYTKEINGDDVTSSTPITLISSGVSGVINDADYQKEIVADKTPTVADSYNNPSSFFPYWSAPVLTYTYALSALTKYDSISN